MRVAKALIYDADGYALVLRRSGTHPYHAFEADLPGGIIEDGETYEQGLVREIKEEAGLTVAEDALIAVSDTPVGFDNKHMFVVHLPDRPAVTLSWEHDRFDWVGEDELYEWLGSSDSYMRFVRSILKP